MALFSFLKNIRATETEEKRRAQQGGVKNRLFNFLDEAADFAEFQGEVVKQLPSAAKRATAPIGRFARETFIRDPIRFALELNKRGRERPSGLRPPLQLPDEITPPQGQDPFSKFARLLIGGEKLTPAREVGEQFGLKGEAASGVGLALTAPFIGRAKPVAEVGQEIIEKGTKKLLPETLTGASKLINLLKTEAAPAREAITAAQKVTKARRFGAGEALLQEGGEVGFKKALGALKGPLTEKTSITSLRGKLAQTDIDEMAEQIRLSPAFDFGDKISTFDGLQKILKGEAPQPKQIELLQDVFGKEFAEVITKAPKSLRDKISTELLEAVNLSRTLLTSIFDMGGVLRQNLIFTATRPKTTLRAGRGALKEAFSPQAFDDWLDTVKQTPQYGEMRRAGVKIIDPRNISKGILAKEEKFASTWAEKIPVLGQVVKATERFHTGLLNKVRYDVWNQEIGKAVAAGTDSAKNRKGWAEFINSATGRGGLGRTGKKIEKELTTAFFSPKLLASRINFLNPFWYAKLPPPVRKEAIKSAALTVGTGLTILSLAKAGGAEVEADPRSSNFGKIRIGNTRWDIWGGFQQVATFMARELTGKTKTSEGIVKETSRIGTAGRFVRGKLAPGVGLGTELAEGERIFGEDLSLKEQAVANLTPLLIQDIRDAFKEQGADALFSVGVPAFFGVGVQSYESKATADKNIREALKRSGTPETKQAVKLTSDFYTTLNKAPDKQKASRKINEALASGDTLKASQLANEYNEQLFSQFTGFKERYGDTLNSNPQLRQLLLQEFKRAMIPLNQRSLSSRRRNLSRQEQFIQAIQGGVR